MNNSGKTLTVFLVLTLVLLVSSTSISFFLFQKEAEQRKAAESQLSVSRSSEMKLQADLKEAAQQITELKEKKKDLEDTLNKKMDEVDYYQGLHEEVKKQNAELKASLETDAKEKEKIRADLAQQITDAQNKAKAAEDQLLAEQQHNKDLQAKVDDLAKKIADAETKMPTNVPLSVQSAATEAGKPAVSSNVQLDKIVVNQDKPVDKKLKGRVLSVDKETDFIIFNLGGKDGIKQGDMFSVYRGDDYLGDVSVSRVQDEMAAADLVPPFSSRAVRKNDIVVPKQQ